jgi:hypothetical protein
MGQRDNVMVQVEVSLLWHKIFSSHSHVSGISTEDILYILCHKYYKRFFPIQFKKNVKKREKKRNPILVTTIVKSHWYKYIRTSSTFLFNYRPPLLLVLFVFKSFLTEMWRWNLLVQCDFDLYNVWYTSADGEYDQSWFWINWRFEEKQIELLVYVERPSCPSSIYVSQVNLGVTSGMLYGHSKQGFFSPSNVLVIFYLSSFGPHSTGGNLLYINIFNLII